MRNLGFVGLATVAAMWAAPANANLFTNGTFNTDASGWTLTSTCGDSHWVSLGNPGGSVQLNSCGGTDGTNPSASQTVSGLTSGATYRIGWENLPHAIITPNGHSFGVAVNGVIIDTSENLSTAWVPDFVDFIAAGTTATIAFEAEVDPTDVSYYVDNLSLLQVGIRGVPEPATLALFGAGLIGLGALRRRRKAKS